MGNKDLSPHGVINSIYSIFTWISVEMDWFQFPLKQNERAKPLICVFFSSKEAARLPGFFFQDKIGVIQLHQISSEISRFLCEVEAPQLCAGKLVQAAQKGPLGTTNATGWPKPSEIVTCPRWGAFCRSRIYIRDSRQPPVVHANRNEREKCTSKTRLEKTLFMSNEDILSK